MSLAAEIASFYGKGKETKNGAGWLTCCPIHGDTNPSMAVTDIGDADVKVYCHTNNCDFKEIKDRMRADGVLPEWTPDPSKSHKTSTTPITKKPEAEEKKSFVWSKASKDGLEHASNYLSGRGVTIDPLPVCIKWNSYKDKISGDMVEMLVAAASKPSDTAVYAVQRLFIDLEDNTKTGAKMLGNCDGRGVWFDRKGDMTEIVAGEGIETVLSAMQATGKNGVATLSTSGMKNLIFPEETNTLYILVDSDPVRGKEASSMPGQKAAYKMAEKFEASKEGRKAILVSPDDTCFSDRPTKQDFNDLLKADPTGESIRERFVKAMDLIDLHWSPSVDSVPEGVSNCKSYEELLAEAQSLKEDSSEEVTKLVREAGYLPPIQKRRVHEAIKKITKIPFRVLEDSKKEGQDGSREDEKDHLQLAKDLAKKIGCDNVLAIQSNVYLWATGFWQKMADRSVKQLVQKYIGNKDVYRDIVDKNTVGSVTDLFKTEVFISDHLFDVGPPECVNTINGELELERDSKKWSLLPHKREHYRTTQIPVKYDSEATAPMFMKFLEEVFKGDPDAADKALALMEMIGYSLMAHCRHEKFIILVGTGANGKSVLLAVLEALLGYQNVAGVQPSQFDRSFQRAHLHGKLANIVTEIKQGEIIDDASLKGIVSGEPTTVEHKFKDPFVMRPFSTCWFGTNHMPHTRDFSDALFRRALVIEFNQVFKPEMGNCDPQLKNKLMEELPGILNLALTAYAAALTNGFTMPESCLIARDNWRLEADQVAQFVDDKIVRDSEGHGIGATKLFDIYKVWANENGIQKQLGIKSFRDRLTRLGFGVKRTSSSRLVTGLTLKEVVVEYSF